MSKHRLNQACTEYQSKLISMNNFVKRHAEVITKYLEKKAELAAAESEVKEEAKPFAVLGETVSIFESTMITVDVTGRRAWDADKAKEVLPAKLYGELVVVTQSIDGKKATKLVDSELAKEIIVDGGAAVSIKLNKHA